MNKNIGDCLLCGLVGELTFEHVPPRAAFNNKRIKVQNHIHLTENTNPLFGKYSKAPRGFGGFTLCKSCNNTTGDWYAKDYTVFAHQAMKNIKSLSPRYWVDGKYNIKPLNVLKQVLTMFMSADKSKHLQSQTDLVHFILNRESQNLPTRFKIYMYSTLSPFYRMQGWCIVSEMSSETISKWAEINFKPFGFLFTEDSNAAHPDQLDISNFKNYKYDEYADILLRLPYLNVNSPEIGTYF
ncbi:MAG: hypothetical protein V4547_03260 [Bacteroidota bacterium]